MPGAYPELKGESLAAFKDGISRLKAKAQTTLGNDYELRDLRAEDLGATTPVFTHSITTTTGWNSIYNNNTITTNRWCMVNGIKYAQSTPLITQLRVTAGGSIKMNRNIENVAADFMKSLYFDPFLVEQNQTLLIEAYNSTTTTNTAERLVFLGVVAEKKGMVLSPV